MRSPFIDERGLSLVEVMVSMGLFLIGLLGLLRMHGIAAGADAYAHHVDRATAVAQDLLSYLERVDHEHPLLADTQPANNSDILDAGETFRTDALAGTAYDHSDAELPVVEDCVAIGSTNACAPPFRGLATAPATVSDLTPTLAFGGAPGDPPEFERYWIIADTQTQGAAGEPARPVKAIAVIVRWRDTTSGTFRRVTALGSAFDPALVTTP